MNSINIYAGINGLEVGQSLVIGFGIVALNVIEISTGSFMRVRDAQTSLFLIVPFIAVSLALLKWNKYPSKVFVGDIYCYFAGIVFAVCGILGHFSKGLLLLFIPQILNFVFSIPQVRSLILTQSSSESSTALGTGLPNTTSKQDY
jgi:UDP-N-acetylglucosamine--dolichyl-phosphate N-acetylglucosaminephosphotransferase